MIDGLEKVKSHRVWFVPRFSVWGRSGLGEIEYLVLEGGGAIGAVHFAQTGIGDTAQSVRFDQLTDHRGNRLPSTLKSPRVLPRRRDKGSVYVVGDETQSSFKIARTEDETEPVTTDLLVIEMGD